MLGYFSKRVLQVIPVLLVISFICFMVIRLVPGDPVTNILGMEATEEAIEALTKELGLDRPLLTQYGDFLVRAVQGDLGTSIIHHKPVTALISERYPATLMLALGATAVASLLGILFGMLSAVYHNKLADNVIMVFSLLAVSTPSFFLAFIMMMVFSVWLGWLPSVGLRTPLHYILPILTLGAQSVGMIARTTRSSMLDVLGQDYIRTARSRGVAPRVIVLRHGFKNALIPVLTIVGLRFGGLLAGSMLVETVFSVPGIGRLMVDAVLNRDYPVVQGTILVLAATFVLVNLLVDMVYALVDPRVKYS